MGAQSQGLDLGSNLASLAQFGVLSAFTLGVAWVADVTLTPALASGLRIVTLWDLLSVDLGEEPEKAIPLLHGLRPAQARVTALMLKLQGYPEGHRLIRAGDAAEGMFVVLEGRLSSSLQRDGHVVPLSVHDRGDVVGELGLLKGERTADVDCDTSVRLLWLDRKSLERLRRRYPWIGGIVYRNLSGIIAERLILTTKRVA